MDPDVGNIFPFGTRGQLPVSFPGPIEFSKAKELNSMPGVRAGTWGVRCTWDVSEIIAEELGVQPPKPPADPNPDMSSTELGAELARMPGLARYHELGLNKILRPYQKEGMAFMARRAFALNCDGMRLGKTIQACSASEMVGSRKTLIICPALTTYVWAGEIARWLDEEAVILLGRRGDYARVFCKVCMGRGYTDDAIHCPACKLRNGQSHGSKILELTDFDRSLIDGVHEARYVIVSYELLQSQTAKDSTGRVMKREDLPGWCPFIARYEFDVAILDEIHRIRGWNTDKTKIGQTRREKVIQAIEGIPRVWGLTGTPVYGFVKDLWGPIDAISKGAVTGPSRLWFDFTVRYAGADKGEYGWVYDGRTIYADTELPRRLEWFKIQRQARDVMDQMPPKTRVVHRLDPDAKARKAVEGLTSLDSRKVKGKLTKLIGQTGTLKRKAVIEQVMEELAAGEKVVVFTWLVNSAERLYKELGKEIRKRQWRRRMEQVNCREWLVHGDRVVAGKRELVAQDFREHKGAGVFVATINSVPEGISLKGAGSVHFAELHWNPADMLQAESRPYALDVRGLKIVYYVVRNSIDEHIEATIMPKFRTLEKIVSEDGATDVRSAFEGPEESEDEILARLTAHLKEDVEWEWQFEDD